MIRKLHTEEFQSCKNVNVKFKATTIDYYSTKKKAKKKNIVMQEWFCVANMNV